ncbi:hypothetical protein D3C79_754870 [compost metagenome]
MASCECETMASLSVFGSLLKAVCRGPMLSPAHVASFCMSQFFAKLTEFSGRSRAHLTPCTRRNSGLRAAMSRWRRVNS